MLKKIFGPRRDQVTGGVEKYTMRSFMLCTPRYYLGDHIEKNELGGAYDMYVGEEKCLQGFVGET